MSLDLQDNIRQVLGVREGRTFQPNRQILHPLRRLFRWGSRTLFYGRLRLLGCLFWLALSGSGFRARFLRRRRLRLEGAELLLQLWGLAGAVRDRHGADRSRLRRRDELHLVDLRRRGDGDARRTPEDDGQRERVDAQRADDGAGRNAFLRLPRLAANDQPRHRLSASGAPPARRSDRRRRSPPL